MWYNETEYVHRFMTIKKDAYRQITIHALERLKIYGGEK